MKKLLLILCIALVSLSLTFYLNCGDGKDNGTDDNSEEENGDVEEGGGGEAADTADDSADVADDNADSADVADDSICQELIDVLSDKCPANAEDIADELALDGMSCDEAIASIGSTEDDIIELILSIEDAADCDEALNLFVAWQMEAAETMGFDPSDIESDLEDATEAYNEAMEQANEALEQAGDQIDDVMDQVNEQLEDLGVEIDTDIENLMNQLGEVNE